MYLHQVIGNSIKRKKEKKKKKEVKYLKITD